MSCADCEEVRRQLVTAAELLETYRERGRQLAAERDAALARAEAAELEARVAREGQTLSAWAGGR